MRTVGPDRKAPRALRRLLAALLSQAERDEILVEMDSLYRCRERRHGQVRAWLWYLRCCLGFPVRLGLRWLANAAPALGSDLRHAAGSLRHDPGFALVVAVVLALGVGGTTAFFSIVDHAVLRPLPYEDPDRLVVLQEYRLERGVPEPGKPGGAMAYANLREVRERLDVFADIGALASSSFLLLGADEPVRVRAGLVEPRLFELLGRQPALGRLLREGDLHAVVLSHGLWRERFAGSEEVLGRTITLDGESYEIVGVMPPDFLPHEPYRLWIALDPATYEWRDRRGLKLISAIGRLADGSSLQEARAAVRVAGTRLAVQYPEANEGHGLWVLPLHEEVVGAQGPVLWRLFAASALLLAIACLNVTNLQLARFTRRRRDAAIRAALGAGRARLLRLVGLESLLVGLLGAAGGALLAASAVRVFVALDPGANPRLADAQVDLRSLSFAVIVACGASVISGVLPLSGLRLSRLLEALQAGIRSASEGLGGRRLRDGLLVAQVAPTVVLLGGAALVSASFLRLWTYDLGFDPDNVLTFGLTLDTETYPEPADQYHFYRRLFDRLEALPEVESVGATSRRPLSRMDIAHELRPRSDMEHRVQARIRPVSGNYFEVMRIPILAGRAFASGDDGRVLLNAAAAERLWPGAAPAEVVGRRVRFVRPRVRGQAPIGEPKPWQEVVGVVGDVRYQGLDPEPVPAAYRPHWQDLWFGGSASFGIAHIVLRTRARPRDLAATIRETVWELDPEEPVQELLTMNEVVAESMARPRFYAFLFSAFAALALTFCIAGVFGVTGYLVAARSREIGVRVALGAAPGAIARLVLMRGSALALGGLAIGVLAGLGLARYLRGFLHGISPIDPAILAVAVGILAVAVLAGMAAPCGRALRVDPANVLREE